MKCYDDIFDKRFLDVITHNLSASPWYATNIANRTTWPYGDKGTHKLLGALFFDRTDDNKITYNAHNIGLSHNFIDMFTAINNHTNNKLKLKQCQTNLQFTGMDGSFHTDGLDNETVYILMLCDEIIDDYIGGDFFNETTNEKVPFKYGRVIEFKASNAHKGLSFNKPHIARISIKWLGQNVRGV